MNRRLTAIVIENEPLFVLGFTEMLERAGIEVLAGGPEWESARKAAGVDSTVVFLGVKGLGAAGKSIARKIVDQAEGSVLLALVSGAEDEDELIDLLIAGAAGYVPRDSDLEPLLPGIVEAARAGELLISRRLTVKLLERLRRAVPDSASGEGFAARLTARELEVLKLLVEGHENDEIAEILVISPSTAKTHVSSVLRKLEADNRLQAAVVALRSGIV